MFVGSKSNNGRPQFGCIARTSPMRYPTNLERSFISSDHSKACNRQPSMSVELDGSICPNMVHVMAVRVPIMHTVRMCLNTQLILDHLQRQLNPQYSKATKIERSPEWSGVEGPPGRRLAPWERHTIIWQSQED